MTPNKGRALEYFIDGILCHVFVTALKNTTSLCSLIRPTTFPNTIQECHQEEERFQKVLQHIP